MIHVHQLTGCAPAPLAHYLKAIGILRLVSEQVDHEARGWWDGDHFRLATKLSQEKLEAFFLYDYLPTPIFNPWGARSGFYGGRSEKSARESLKEIEHSSSPRLEPFRTTIRTVRSIITNTTGGNKPSDKEKDRLILALRLNTRGKSSLWLDTVVALIGSGKEVSLAQPPIFGTGGSEGSGGYPSAYMSAIVESVVKANWNHAVSYTLFGGPAPQCHWDQSMGQFAPGGISTPWDMLLAFEGACMLRSSVGSRTSTNSKRWMSSPFYVAPRSSGYASRSRLDEKLLNKGREYPGRGEQWLPMWTKPSRHFEIQMIFTQGRATTKAGRATDGWTMAKAVADFGVSRGISQFVRYGYQQRNNQATHFAVPLGRFCTPGTEQGTSTKPSCLDDLDGWLRTIHQVAHPADDQKAKRVPIRMLTTYGRLMDTLFSVITEQATVQQYQDVLLCLGDMEAVMRQGTGFAAQPVPRLSPEWVTASYDGTPEYRLALAFALQAANFRRDSGTPIDPIRRHWLPLDKEQPWRFATTGTGSGSMLDMKPEVVMHGRRGLDDAIALIERRMIESSQREGRHLPLKPARGTVASTADLNSLLSGKMDLDRVLVLGRALMALGSRAWAKQRAPIKYPRTIEWPDDAWLAIRLCTLPWPLKIRSGFELNIGTDPAIVRRLAAGDAASALTIALRRLRAAGVNSTLRTGVASYSTAQLWAAALAFPINRNTAEQFLHRLDPNLDSETS